MIEIHLFEQLAAFASCGTLSAAAEQLHISQPALSRSMQRLEDELGVKLFDRQKSRLTLNENGELAVRCARSLILQETSMIEQIREFDRKKRTISVGSCTPILVPDFVSLLSRLYEGMTISTELTGEPHLEKHLRDNKYQLAILHERPDEKEFYSLPIESEHLYVFLPPVHPLADAQGLYLRDLDGQTFLLYSQIGFWDGLCRREMPSARFLLQQDYEVLGELVQNSALPSFTTDYVLKREPFESDRIAVPILDEEANVTYYCACLRSEKSRFRDVFRNLQTFHGNSHL
ncbi:MAG TPA: LysR family transcriptional regulator [Candidatus Mediterraneibacter colneyensis]|nr:LysR family transcriptional regulator [Candidatus Mediterraneibacter colneyensis]